MQQEIIKCVCAAQLFTISIDRIAEPSDGLDMTRRGKLWGNKQAVAVAKNAQKVELIPCDGDEWLPLDIEEVDQHGGVSFSILPTTI